MELKAKVMLASPLFSGDVCGQFVYSALGSQLLCLGRGILLEFKWIQNLSLVQCARNYLLKVFLEGDYTHLLYVDADLGWSCNAIHRMVERNVDVIGGVYPRKNNGEFPMPYVQMGGCKEQTGLLEVFRLPTGFLLLSRKAVEKAVEGKPVYTMEVEGFKRQVAHVFDIKYDYDKKDIISEDYAFCDELRELGFKLYCELDINFSHSGRGVWTGNLLKRLTEVKSKVLSDYVDSPPALEPIQSHSPDGP